VLELQRHFEIGALDLEVMLCSLVPEVHVEGWKAKGVDKRHAKEEECLEVEGNIEWVGHGHCERLWLLVREASKILPDLVAAKELARDSQGIQDDEEVVAEASNNVVGERAGADVEELQ